MKIERLHTKRQHPFRKHPPKCFILHSTGSLEEEAIVRYYRTSSDGVCPHFLVKRNGDVVQFEDLDRVAYHTGMSDAQETLYRRGLDVWTRHLKDGSNHGGFYSGYAEWVSRWPGKKSPLELLSGASPNGSSIGIEATAERGLLTEAQYETLSNLILTMAEDQRIEVGKETVLGHADSNPIARSDSRGLTDPGPYFSWDKLFGLMS